MSSIIKSIEAAPSIEALDRFMALRPPNHRNRPMWEVAAHVRRCQLMRERMWKNPRTGRFEVKTLQQLTREIIASDGNEDRIRRMAYEAEVRSSEEQESKPADISLPTSSEILAELFKRTIASFPFHSNRAGMTERRHFTFHANKQGAGKSILERLMKTGDWVGRRKCPFCGSLDVHVVRHSGDTYDVVCKTCTATGPLGLSVSQAWSDWNKRS